MTRLVLFLILTAVVAAGVAWFADHPGRLTIHWLDTRIESSVAALAALFALVLLLGVGLQRLVTWIMRDLPFSPAKRAERRQGKGMTALNQALVALSSGDERRARKLTRNALRLLPAQPLTHVMAAEAARIAGDRATVRAHYAALAEMPEAAFLGLRGLANDARADGRVVDARRLVEEALEAHPDSGWALDALFELQVAAADWGAAGRTLDRIARLKLRPAARLRRERAALAYCRAVEADLSGHADDARKLAQQAIDGRPDFVPALQLLARYIPQQDRQRRAFDKRLRVAWAQTPHPALEGLAAPDDGSLAPHERLERIRALIPDAPDMPESRLALAEAALGAGHAKEAKTALETLSAADGPRYGALTARLARDHDRGDAADGSGQLAVGAGQLQDVDGGGWQCGACGARRASWTPLCPSCGRFDSYDWQRAAPQAGRVAAAGEMLTLLGRSGGDAR